MQVCRSVGSSQAESESRNSISQNTNLKEAFQQCHDQPRTVDCSAIAQSVARSTATAVATAVARVVGEVSGGPGCTAFSEGSATGVARAFATSVSEAAAAAGCNYNAADSAAAAADQRVATAIAEACKYISLY